MFKEEVIIFGVSKLDFTPEGSDQRVQGSKIYYSRPAYDNEKGRFLNDVVVKTVFVRSDSSIKTDFSKLPAQASLVYQPQGRYNVLAGIEVK